MFLGNLFIFLTAINIYAEKASLEALVSASLEEDYTIVHYYTASGFVVYEYVDFSTLISTSSYSRSLSEAPYTPSNKIDASIQNGRGIVGDDDLDDVSNVTVAPYCKIVAIECVFNYEKNGVSQSYSDYCSGVIMGPDLVLTAGHVVFRSHYGGWPDKCYVYTEMTSENDYYSKSTVTEIAVNEQCLQHNGNFDWAYLKTDTNIGGTQGWMGMSAESASNYENMPITVAGYPSNGCVMYYNESLITAVDSKYIVRTSADALGGMSGCPYFSNDQYVRAIHKAGVRKSADGTYLYNIGTVITPELFYVLRAERYEGIEKYS